MKSLKDIQKIVKKFNVKPRSEMRSRVLDEALEIQRNRKQQNTSETYKWRIIMKTKTAKFAIAAMIIVAVLAIFNSSESTLSAQVIKAAKKARTIHITGLSPKDGQLQKSNEIWYERGSGIKITWDHKGKKHLMLDNGKYRWKYSQGNTSAVQNKSLGIDDLPREITEPSRYLDKCTRDNTGDMVIDGILCELYTGFYPEKPDSTRVMFWIDPDNRFRRFEEKVLEGEVWKTVEIGQVEYDTDFEASIFKPDFGPDVVIVKADEMLDKSFALENAIFKTEEMGLIFAVHEIQRCQNDLIFTVTSLRPNQKLKGKFASKGITAWNYGNYQFGPSYERLGANKHRSYSPREVAWFYRDGLVIRWTVFIPRGFEPERVNKIKLELYYLYTNGSWAAKRKADGLEDRMRINPIAVLPLPDDSVTLDTQLNKTYNLIKLFESMTAEIHLSLKPIPFTNQEMDEWIKDSPNDGIAKMWKKGIKQSRLSHGQSKKPSEIDEQSWIEDRLESINNMRDQ